MQLNLKKTDVAILSILANNNSRSVEIATKLKLDKRTIHRHLTPMEENRLVEGRYFKDKKTGYSVTIKRYQITSKGKQVLRDIKDRAPNH